MTQGWDALDTELALWTEQGLHLPFWWRDDDAVAPSPALTRLEDLAARMEMPVHLAIIPRDATPELAAKVTQSAHLLPVVHGWAHKNHAPAAQKKCEFGSTRPIDLTLEEAEAGLTRLKELFGPRLIPMFVPPWNRVSSALLPWLAGLDYAMLSTYGPRKREHIAPGLTQINTHLDPIDWHGSRSLRDEEELLAGLVEILRARRTGSQDNDEPLGLLTHHLEHDDAIWRFCETLIARLLAGPAQPWRSNDKDMRI
ncbi:polysaccharide deacetylase family protein [Phaeobacter sp. HF9A]|uniref:polysaccharide deacetylase family protein n=1 Tax=Phaeobacter sp. HF9A TaxID=2721561 RepID=UPI001431FF3B|nr:polysaccharide deacetylase family protein [Phaeobacter sp. HF9A]NIZ15244.1 polysaccharide deacetylase [Phaeobacter sp. HF9A]